MASKWDLWSWLSTLGGLGYLKPGPGTLGTLAAIPVCIGLRYLPGTIALALVIALIVIAIVVCDYSSRSFSSDDPGEIILDEFVAFLALGVLVPVSGMNLIVLFVLFRMFDILKPWPIRQLEKLPGGLGIVADDLGASAASYLCFVLFNTIFPPH